MNGAPPQVISVAELHRRLRRLVESASGRDWVEGEVSSLKRAPSGHAYFCLKDEREDAVIDCVMYRLAAQRARRHLVDGARVQLLGRATVWAPRGRLQLVAELARPAGRGALLVALDELKQRLAQEGLFAKERKRALPDEPLVVGVVTSASGAAFHDICSVAFRRGGARIVLSPALVQGEGAVASLLRAIKLIERYPGLNVLVIGRGGGSDEDLMAFNDERVVRRLATVRVPVVSAVGHETDYTLTDLVADVRAATPSQAAELVIPDARARRELFRRVKLQLARAMHGRMLELGSELDQVRLQLGDPRFLIAERQQSIDDARMRLERWKRRSLARRLVVLEQLHRRLLARHPRTMIADARARLGPLSERLKGTMRLELGSARGVLGENAEKLHALSPLAVLARGYAILSHPDGRTVRSLVELGPGDEIMLRVRDGRLGARVNHVYTEVSESSGPDSAREPGRDQEPA